MLCAAYLTETRHTGWKRFGNAFVTGYVSIQNHPKIVSGVFQYEFSSHESEAGSDPRLWKRRPAIKNNSFAPKNKMSSLPQRYANKTAICNFIWEGRLKIWTGWPGFRQKNYSNKSIRFRVQRQRVRHHYGLGFDCIVGVKIMIATGYQK